MQPSGQGLPPHLGPQPTTSVARSWPPEQPSEQPGRRARGRASAQGRPPVHWQPEHPSVHQGPSPRPSPGSRSLFSRNLVVRASLHTWAPGPVAELRLEVTLLVQGRTATRPSPGSGSPLSCNLVVRASLHTWAPGPVAELQLEVTLLVRSLTAIERSALVAQPVPVATFPKGNNLSKGGHSCQHWADMIHPLPPSVLCTPGSSASLALAPLFGLSAAPNRLTVGASQPWTRLLHRRAASRQVRHHL